MKWILPVLIFMSSQSLWATKIVYCSKAYRAAVPLEKALDLKKLKKAGFALNSKSQLVDLKTGETFGKVGVLEVPYLYEWASQEHHLAWKQMGGITDAEMDRYLEARPQGYGKGYYVSTHPSDSQSFGDALTTFKTQGPLVYMVYEHRLYQKQMDFYKRLQRAGVDGVLNSEGGTWLAMISSKHLAITDETLLDPQFFNPLHESFLLWAVRKNFHVRLPETPLKRTAEALSDIKNTKKLLADDRVESFETLMKMTRIFGYESILKELGTEPVASLRNSLSVFDLMVFDRVLKKPTAEIKDLKALAEKSKEHFAKRKKVNLRKIKNLDDFVHESQALFDHPIQFRNESVVMSNLYGGFERETILPADYHSLVGFNHPLTLNFKNENGTSLVYVEYLSLLKIHQRLAPFLKEETRNKLWEFQAGNGKTAGLRPAIAREEVQQVTRAAMKEIAEPLFSDNRMLQARFLTQLFGESVTATDVNNYMLYRAFMIIHPFQDGNGRLGRLYYEWLTLQANGKSDALELADFNVDVFMRSSEIESFHQDSKLINLWVGASTNQSQLQSRIQVAKNYLKKKYPRYSSLWE